MNTVVKSVITLTIFTFLERTLGFFFKIYLSRELGAVGLGIYQVALSVFFVLLALVTSGVPLIVSKLTAKHRAEKNFRAEGSLTSAALIIELVIATAISAIVLALSKQIGGLFASRQSMTLLILLLPSLIFSAVYSSFRGSMWGRQKYLTVSFVEIAEQIARIIICVVMFALGFDKVKTTALSFSLACVVSAGMCVLCYFVSKGTLRNPKGYIKPLIRSSTPITLIRASSSLNSSIVALIVPFLLRFQGMSAADAMYVFGSSVGMALPLLYLPITVVGSLAYVMIPTLSASMAKDDIKHTRTQIESAISFSIVVSIIFVPMFFALGEPIGAFVYRNIDAGKFLAASAWLLVPLSVENITSSMMNSLDLERASFVNYSIGSVILFAFLFAFTGHFNIMLLSVGMGVSLSISVILDIRSIRKKTGIRLTFIPTLIKGALLSLPTIFLTRSLYDLTRALPAILRLGISSLTGILFIVMLSIVFGSLGLDAFTTKRKRHKTIAKNDAI